jgi:hypothetical protein
MKCFFCPKEAERFFFSSHPAGHEFIPACKYCTKDFLNTSSPYMKELFSVQEFEIAKVMAA